MMERGERLAEWVRARRRLRLIRWISLLDLVFLIMLVVASRVLNDRGLVSVLGPIHGGTFLVLLVLAYTGAADRVWSWWFPVGVLCTGGAPGALLGEWLIGRRMARQSAENAA
jgi:hypothetical protein